jgi:CrcB protein
MTAVVWVAVFAIGGAGSVLRLVVGDIVMTRRGRDFPYGTLVVNLSGSLVLGLLAGIALSHDGTLLAGTAAIGSYTTFSTWLLETERLTVDRSRSSAVLNVVVSLVLGVAAAALGKAIGGAL